MVHEPKMFENHCFKLKNFQFRCTTSRSRMAKNVSK